MKSKKSSQAVLLASGGLDSTVLAFWLLRKKVDVIPLFIDYGQHSRTTEFETLKKVLPTSFTEKINVARIPDVYRGSSSRMIREPNLWLDQIQDHDLHLPHRNLLLLATGVAFAETRNISQIYAAFIETHRALGADCNSAFFKVFNQLLSATSSVKLKLPFQHFSKAQVAKLGVNLGAPIAQTFSCLAASRFPCGACPNCVDRTNALDFVR